MSMHMIRGVQVHGNSKKKPRKLDMKALELEWRRYNKDMRRKNMHKLQFEDFNDYALYVQGKMPKRKQQEEFKTYAPYKPHVRNTTQYPSLKTSDTIPDSCSKQEPNKYTGDLIVGIGVMHKSNLVPIMRGTNEAKDIANMRRN